MEDDREMRVDEAPIPDNGDRHSKRNDDRERERSRSRERRHRDRDDDRHRSHRRRSPSRSRSRSPGYRRDRHRHRSRSGSRSRSPRGDRHDRRRRPMTPPPLHGRGKFGAPRQEWEKSVGGPMNAPIEEAEAHAKVSKRENRLYVGNLAYDCNYKDLEKYMSGAGGDVIFTEILITPTGQSKGCGIVEFSNPEDAQRAKADLADKPFMGRSVFIREDREEAARFGVTPIPGKVGLAMGESNHYLGAANANNRNIFVGSIPFQASWQDLKDLFRQAGEVIRADIGMTPDGRAKGNGTVVFSDPEGAKAAIEMFNGYDWYGSILQVREDRFAGQGGFRGGFRGGLRGGMGLGRGGFVPRGAFGGGRGGFGGPMRGAMMGGMGLARGGFGPGAGVGGGRNFTNDLYADYNGPGGANGNGMAVDPAATGFAPRQAEPNQQILVRNLPWSTSHEDLVELFETVGSVVLAEILFDGQRSRGEGVVQFTETAEAQTAGEKFMGYNYGGRPLGKSTFESSGNYKLTGM
ncbi:hypothetical protein BCR39DRAFT_513770 [Naematelia encephala]|uniref:RRM domain-containing protein n=1 Tax=Naematelia encephala TaxID=71784 RepID=A0A1Y2BJ69_9TREE|nr:hypothetical protein BCR39DRAFT_513770 [Naematelia encephala]